MIDRKFDMTNFEQSLKEHSDQFSMTPSKKVWQGLYNDLHPSKKWPSIAMLCMFIFSFLGIGYLNNNTNSNRSDKNENAIQNALEQSSVADIDNNSPKISSLSVASVNAEAQSSSPGKMAVVANNMAPKSRSFETNLVSLTDKAEQSLEIKEALQLTPPIEEKNTVLELQNEQNASIEINPIEYSLPDPKAAEAMEIHNELLDKNLQVEKENTTEKVALKLPNNPRFDLSVFITPTISSASFNKSGEVTHPGDKSLVALKPTEPRRYVIMNDRLGFKAGVQAGYRLGDNWQIVVAPQVSYSGYTVVSNTVQLSVNKLSLRDERGKVYSQNYITNYGNGKGDKDFGLNNYSLQFSVPIGMELQLWENNNAKISVATSAGPTFIIKSNAFLISSDGRNYLNDQSLMRNTNISGYMGVNFSFKSMSLRWKIGPSVSYQFLSTYKDIYPVKEHLIDYGIRIGISK